MKKRKATRRKKIQPRAIIDSVALYFPLFSSYKAQYIKAYNGVSFWRQENYNCWYTGFELSRFDGSGEYTPPLLDAKPQEQNNISIPTYHSIIAAFDRIYDGYIDVTFPADRERFAKLTSTPRHYADYAARITRLDVAFDLPSGLIPTPDELIYYISHGMGSGNRYFSVAAKQGIYFYQKKNKSWIFEKKNADGTRERLKTEKPYFMKSRKRLKKAILTGEATIYVGTKNSEIKIYRKDNLIRYELSAKKSILRKLMHDRRPQTLLAKNTMAQIFTAAAARIGVLFAHGEKKEMFYNEVQKAIISLLRNFRPLDKARAGYPESAALIYNNVIIHGLTPLLERERPPPFSFRSAK